MKRKTQLNNPLSLLISAVEYGIKNECVVKWKKKIGKKSIGKYISHIKKPSKIFIKKSLRKRKKLATQTLLHEGIHHMIALQNEFVEEDLVLTLERKLWRLMSKKQKRIFVKLLPK